MRKGSISVFLALLLSFVLVFDLVLLESARLSGLRYAEEAAGKAAVNSIQAAFIRQLFDEYGLLFYDGGRGSGWIDTAAIEETAAAYYRENRAPEALIGKAFFRASAVDVSVLEIETATDCGGAPFMKNAAAFFPYEAAGEVLALIREELALFGEGDAAKADADAKDQEREETDWGAYGQPPDGADRVRLPGAAERILPPADVGAAGDGAVKGGAAKAGVARVSEADGGTAEPPDFDEGRYDEAIAESPIGGADEIRAKGWLGLVLPQGTAISGVTFDTAEFPSKIAVDERPPEEAPLPGLLEKVSFNEYLLHTFSNYREEKRSGSAHYETEYLLFGKASDEENLKAALDRIMWMREGVNVLYLYGSAMRREEAMALAAVLTGWAGIPLLTLLTQASLIAAWAYAESILDVRTLLAGKKVPVLKTDESWTLSLAGVAGFLKGQAVQAKSTETGMDYRGFLRLLLYLKDPSELAYRAMDMIQLHLRRHDSHFNMANAVSALKLRITSVSSPVFSALPLVQKYLPGTETPYVSSRIYTMRYQ